MTVSPTISTFAVSVHEATVLLVPIKIGAVIVYLENQRKILLEQWKKGTRIQVSYAFAHIRVRCFVFISLFHSREGYRRIRL